MARNQPITPGWQPLSNTSLAVRNRVVVDIAALRNSNQAPTAILNEWHARKLHNPHEALRDVQRRMDPNLAAVNINLQDYDEELLEIYYGFFNNVAFLGDLPPRCTSILPASHQAFLDIEAEKSPFYHVYGFTEDYGDIPRL